MAIIKKIVKSNLLIYKLALKIHKLHQKGHIDIKGDTRMCSFKKDIVGFNNSISVGGGGIIDSLKLHIRGNNNKICIGEGCRIGPECNFWMEGNNTTLIIGNNTSFNWHVHICIQEDDMCVRIGNNCMFSNHLIIRTSDSHSIISIATGKRINPPLPILIGNHVWIAPDSKIFKGVTIGDGSIIGSNTLVTHDVPANCLAVGIPARVVKENVEWDRQI